MLDLSQFLSGPYAALRLMDLGARVIKIERPDGGDLCHRLSDSEIGEEQISQGRTITENQRGETVLACDHNLLAKMRIGV